VVTKRERSNTAKLAVFKSVFFPILACGHESCVTTGSAISSTSGRDGIFAKSSRCYTHDKVCSCEIRKALNVEPPVIWIERYLLRWFCHVTRMSQERMPRQVLLATPTGNRPRGWPSTKWSGYISYLAWSRRSVNYQRLLLTAARCFGSPLGLLPWKPPRENAGENNWRNEAVRKKTLTHTFLDCIHFYLDWLMSRSVLSSCCFRRIGFRSFCVQMVLLRKMVWECFMYFKICWYRK